MNVREIDECLRYAETCVREGDECQAEFAPVGRLPAGIVRPETGSKLLRSSTPKGLGLDTVEEGAIIARAARSEPPPLANLTYISEHRTGRTLPELAYKRSSFSRS